jgi:cytoskeletal protein CcmA (bactofilin family)
MANEFVIKNGYLSRGDSEITGSLIVTGGITGSLFGTASWADNATTASYVVTAETASYVDLVAGPNITINQVGTSFEISGSGGGSTFPYTGSAQITGSLEITGSLLLTSSYISEVDYIDFRNIGTTLPADQQGRIYWDDDNGTLSLGMHGGQVVQQIGLEEFFYVKNQTGVTIPNGSVVRAAGTLGSSGRLLGDLMIADGSIPYYFALGVATEDIVDGDDGYVTQFGLVRGLNTTGSNGETWNDGDVLYVSPTFSGSLTNIEPEAPNLRLQMAIVISADTNGSIFVRPDLGSDVGSLHDVVDTTTTASYGELFVKSGSVWTSTTQLTGSYAITGSLEVIGSQIISGTLEVHNGNVNITSNANFFQGASTGGSNVSLIGVNLSDQIYIGNQGYDNIIADDTTISGSLTVTSSLTVQGSTTLSGSLTTKTYRLTAASYTASASDYRIAVRYTDTGSVAIQLPLISEVGELEYKFKDEEGNAQINRITITASGSDLIDGDSNAILNRNYMAIGLYNDGVSNWYIE